MKGATKKEAGFSLFEVLAAMGLFVIAAVSLAEALNVISLTVSESIEETEIRELLRGQLLLATRDPDIQEEVRETNENEQGVFFKIESVLITPENFEGQTLADLYEVRVTAYKRGPLGREQEIDVASTYVYPGMF